MYSLPSTSRICQCYFYFSFDHVASWACRCFRICYMIHFLSARTSIWAKLTQIILQPVGFMFGQNWLHNCYKNSIYMPLKSSSSFADYFSSPRAQEYAWYFIVCTHYCEAHVLSVSLISFYLCNMSVYCVLILVWSNWTLSVVDYSDFKQKIRDEVIESKICALSPFFTSPVKTARVYTARQMIFKTQE